jgi:hypothetical protein
LAGIGVCCTQTFYVVVLHHWVRGIVILRPLGEQVDAEGFCCQFLPKHPAARQKLDRKKIAIPAIVISTFIEHFL